MKVQSEKEGNRTEPGTQLPHVCSFQLVLSIIAQLFPYRELHGELIIKEKLNAFKAGEKKKEEEKKKKTSFLSFWHKDLKITYKTEISNETFGVTGHLKAIALLFSFFQITHPTITITDQLPRKEHSHF